MGHLDALLNDPMSGMQSGLRWAIAGRNESKLAVMASKCKSTPSVIHVGGSEEEIENMVGDCKVILTIVGPFITYGEPVVAACIKKRTHYIDVSGEHAFVHYMIEKYDAQAKEAGVLIVTMVGQVVTPNDVSLQKLVTALGPLKQYRDYFFQSG